MNTGMPFDPQRSAAIKRMLMDTVVDSPQREASVRRRAGLVAALVAAALVLAGGSAAVAFNANAIFPPDVPAPVSTTTSPPTPSPSPTVTRPPQSAPAQTTPGPTVPLACNDFTPASLGDGAAPVLASDGFYRVADAAQVQAGVLHCQWNDYSAGGFIALNAVADADRGREEIDRLLSGPWTKLGVGDESAWACVVTGPGCSSEVVTGDYWVSLNVERRGLTADEGKTILATVGRQLDEYLRAHPAHPRRWQAPSTSWDGLGCTTFSDAGVGAILGTPGVTGPVPVSLGAVSAIAGYGAPIACRWFVPDNVVTAPGVPRGVSVDIAPGSAWAWDRRDLSGTDVENVAVQGADRAEMVCVPSEGSVICWLDVLADQSWMRVSSEAPTVGGDRERFIAIAEAVIAAR